LLNLVVLDVLDHSGQFHSRLSEELRHRHSGYPVALQGGAAVMVEITFPLLVLVSCAAPLPPSPSPYFAASISLPFREPRLHPARETERTRLLLVELLLWASPREFKRPWWYPKYRRNNPPFRFNLLHFARIHVEPL